jgi:gamma-glutamylcyclotransferase (GGCT)/AIG2-like uncharacterized protein YtfP
MLTIFVYETLLDPDLVRKVVGRKIKEEKATLQNHKVVHEKGYGYLEWTKGSFVHGATMELIREEVAKLDAWESKYKRTPVKLEDGTDAWAYELKDHLKEGKVQP